MGLDLNKELEAIFRRSFAGTNAELDVFHQPSQYDLYQALASGKYYGIFFVSHSYKNDRNKNRGLVALDMIPNQEHVDIKPILNTVNTDFFAFCGCYSQSHLDEMALNRAGKPMQTFGYGGVVEAKYALKNAINFFLERMSLEGGDEQISKKLSGETLQIPMRGYRYTPPEGAPQPAIQILANGSLLAMLPESEPGEAQQVEFVLSVPRKSYNFSKKKDANALSITVSNGRASVDFSGDKPGTMSFTSDELLGSWQVYQKSDGSPSGYNQNLYRYWSKEN